MNQFFYSNFLYIIDFSSISKYKFAFPSTAIIIYCLTYLLKIPYSNQIHHFFLVEGSVLVYSLHLDNIFGISLHFGNIFRQPYCNVRWGSHTKIILTFLFLWLWFCHCHRRRVCVWYSDKYSVHGLFIVYRPSIEI